MSDYEFCSCNGENENCYKCYGKGIVGEETSTRREYKILSKQYYNTLMKQNVSLNPNMKIKKLPKRKLGNIIKECPVCCKGVEDGDFNNHISNEHEKYISYVNILRKFGKKEMIFYKPSRAFYAKKDFYFENLRFLIIYTDRVEENTVICPVCKGEYFVKGIVEHVRIAHELNKKIAYKIKTFEPKCKCLGCGAIIKEKNVKKHQRKIHGNIEQPMIKSKSVENIFHQEREKQELLTKKRNNLEQQERNRIVEEINSSQYKISTYTDRDIFDATKDYAHNFREHGRYGSHPIHDDYDEIDND